MGDNSSANHLVSLWIRVQYHLFSDEFNGNYIDYGRNCLYLRSPICINRSKPEL